MAQIMKAAKPADMTKAEEKYWKESEEAVEDTYDPEGSDAQKGKYYGTATNIFKAKVQKHLGYDPFKKKKKKDDDKPKSKKKKKKSDQAYAIEARAFRFQRQADVPTEVESPEETRGDSISDLIEVLKPASRKIFDDERVDMRTKQRVGEIVTEALFGLDELLNT